MKKHWTNQIRAVSDLIPKRVFDESAQTIGEIAADSGVSVATADRLVRGFLAAGKAYRVWKRGSQRAIPAYRIKP